MQAMLSESLAAGGSRHTIHPGELGWWFFHQDPSRTPLETLIEDDAFAVIDANGPEISVFGRPGAERVPLLDAALERVDERPTVGFVAHTDTELADALRGRGFEPDPAFELEFKAAVAEVAVPSVVPDGYTIRPVAGEEETWSRRAASHAAFASSLEPELHHQRYLRFMRSEVYVPERDLVAVHADGRVAAFLVWWGDEASGVAQLEPVGTHPDHQRRGLGRALLARAAGDMAAAGMHTVRVGTGAHRSDAVAFYRRSFREVGRTDWWRGVR
jgi:ribosomal protein S18 acetylase RimI-like enzyme